VAHGQELRVMRRQPLLQPSPLVGTLAHVMLSDQYLLMYCESCHHRTSVDLLAQVEAHGEAYSLQTFIDGAVCSKSGARWPKLSVTLTPASA
jgi:hypothetical protein